VVFGDSGNSRALSEVPRECSGLSWKIPCGVWIWILTIFGGSPKMGYKNPRGFPLEEIFCEIFFYLVGIFYICKNI
jgi:hypothetical protein